MSIMIGQFEICRDRHMDAVGYNRETRYSYSLPLIPKSLTPGCHIVRFS